MWGEGGLRDIRGCCGFVGKIERNPVHLSIPVASGRWNILGEPRPGVLALVGHCKLSAALLRKPGPEPPAPTHPHAQA